MVHRRDQAWPPIDSEGWVTVRGYNDRDLQTSLQRFLDERRKSLEWLASLDTPDLKVYESRPGGGKLRAGDMLAAWLAHDLLHLWQLVE
jgi:hypothetical protein